MRIQVSGCSIATLSGYRINISLVNGPLVGEIGGVLAESLLVASLVERREVSPLVDSIKTLTPYAFAVLKSL